MKIRWPAPRRRVRTEQEISIPAASGGGAPASAVVCDRVPAKIAYRNASRNDEMFKLQQNQSSLFADIYIRYRPQTNIDASMQVVYGSRRFNIRSVQPIEEEQRFILLFCEELQAKGS